LKAIDVASRGKCKRVESLIQREMARNGREAGSTEPAALQRVAAAELASAQQGRIGCPGLA
jgi:hypothetical protein